MMMNDFFLYIINIRFKFTMTGEEQVKKSLYGSEEPIPFIDKDLHILFINFMNSTWHANDDKACIRLVNCILQHLFKIEKNPQVNISAMWKQCQTENPGCQIGPRNKPFVRNLVLLVDACVDYQKRAQQGNGLLDNLNFIFSSKVIRFVILICFAISVLFVYLQPPNSDQVVQAAKIATHAKAIALQTKVMMRHPVFKDDSFIFPARNDDDNSFYNIQQNTIKKFSEESLKHEYNTMNFLLLSNEHYQKADFSNQSPFCVQGTQTCGVFGRDRTGKVTDRVQALITNRVKQLHSHNPELLSWRENKPLYLGITRVQNIFYNSMKESRNRAVSFLENIKQLNIDDLNNAVDPSTKVTAYIDVPHDGIIVTMLPLKAMNALDAPLSTAYIKGDIRTFTMLCHQLLYNVDRIFQDLSTYSKEVITFETLDQLTPTQQLHKLLLENVETIPKMKPSQYFETFAKVDADVAAAQREDEKISIERDKYTETYHHFVTFTVFQWAYNLFFR